jgi:hypothetical protein
MASLIDLVMKKLAMLVGFISCSLPTISQVSIQQGVVSISSPFSQLIINSQLNNQGKLIHRGELIILADFYNYSEYKSIQGTLVLAAAADQIVSSDTLALGTMRIVNGYSKTLDGNFQLQQKLVLEDGILFVPEKSQLTLLENAVISQSNQNSYIEGTLYHHGTGAKFYPIGNQNEYAPVTLDNVQGDASKVGMKYDPISGQPRWFQHLAEGTYEGSTVTVSFTSNNADYFSYSEQLTVMAGPGEDQVTTSIGARSIGTSDTKITLSSKEATAYPWITVGFVVDEAEEEVFVPNAFSPQASHLDDQGIKVYGRYLSSQNFQFGIQDTWGRWVYQTTSLEEAMNEGWSATTLSSSSSQFRYIISGKFISGRTFQRSDVIVKF